MSDAELDDLDRRVADLTRERDELREELANHCCCIHDGRGELVDECQEHKRIREERDELQTRLAAAGHAPECGSQICARCGRDYFALVHKPSHENYSPHDFVPGACTQNCYQHQEWDHGN